MKGVDLKKRKGPPGYTGALVLYGKEPCSERERVREIRAIEWTAPEIEECLIVNMSTFSIDTRNVLDYNDFVTKTFWLLLAQF